jgi:hypothetical protein
LVIIIVFLGRCGNKLLIFSFIQTSLVAVIFLSTFSALKFPHNPIPGFANRYQVYPSFSSQLTLLQQHHSGIIVVVTNNKASIKFLVGLWIVEDNNKE